MSFDDFSVKFDAIGIPPTTSESTAIKQHHNARVTYKVRVLPFLYKAFGTRL
jgi:hypothetical protein